MSVYEVLRDRYKNCAIMWCRGLSKVIVAKSDLLLCIVSGRPGFKVWGNFATRVYIVYDVGYRLSCLVVSSSRNQEV